MIDNIMNAIGEFLGQGANQNSIRERILGNLKPDAVEQTTQEPIVKQPMIPDQIQVNAPDPMDDIGFYEENIDETLSDFEPIDVRSNAEINATKPNKEDTTNAAIQTIAQGRGGLTRNKSQANVLYMNMLKDAENKDRKGLTTINGEKKFMPFKSISEKKEKGISEFEIGYGIKIKDDWLSDDHRKWLNINDIPVNVKEGLTQDQVDALLKENITKNRDATSTQLTKWSEMTEEEKMGWQDLTYNGGLGLLKSISEAKTAANKGYTMEGLVKLTHFTRAGSVRYRGLLKRRLNLYNHAALSNPGAPVIEKYEFGPKGMRIKFSSKLIGDKFSNAFKKRVNSNDGWYNVPGKVKEGKDKLYKVNDEYQFE